jgi:hypothetical protein
MVWELILAEFPTMVGRTVLAAIALLHLPAKCPTQLWALD